MTDQTESASEYADLLRALDVDGDDEGVWFSRDAAAAIRALEAKARETDTSLARMAGWWNKTIAERDELRANRDRLAGEVERLERQVADRTDRVLQLEVYKTDALNRAAEVARLTAELAAAKGDAECLMHLLSSAWFYGAWKAETYNEREMQKILERHGYWPTTEAQLIARHEDAARRAGGEG